jgi:hypothetical protein
VVRVPNPLQDPLKSQRDYDIGKIIRQAKEREKARNLNNQAWTDYVSCVSREPAAQEYHDAANVAALKASLPIPSLPAVGKVGYRTRSGIRAGGGATASLVTRANIFTLVFSGMLHILFADASEGLEPFREKLQAVQKACMDQTKRQYGFAPRGWQLP